MGAHDVKVTCAHDVKVTKRVGYGRTSRLNNVLVFESTSIVMGNIPTEYIKCESVTYSIKENKTVNLDDDFTVTSMSRVSYKTCKPRQV